MQKELPLSLEAFQEKQLRHAKETQTNLWTQWVPMMAKAMNNLPVVPEKQRRQSGVGSDSNSDSEIGRDYDSDYDSEEDERSSPAPEKVPEKLSPQSLHALSVLAASQMRMLVVDSFKLCTQFFQGYAIVRG
jgi:hypothetical protein